MNLGGFKTELWLLKKNVDKNERMVRTWAGLDTIISSLLTETSHEMFRLKCLLIGVHNRCDIVCTVHLILNSDFLSPLVLSHVTFVSCGKRICRFFKTKTFHWTKSVFFKCTDILLQNWASYFLHCSSIVVLYILLKQTDIFCNITELLLTFMLFSMTVLFNLMVKTT